MNMELIQSIITSLPGIVAFITLIYQLIKYVSKSIKAKRWPELITLVMNYMQRAETMFTNGADKKEWVMAMVKATADSIKYEVDMDVVSEMIDSMCDMSRVVNAPVSEAGE